MSNSPVKFVWKGYSEKLNGNLSIAYAGESKDSSGVLCAKLGVVLFEIRGIRELAAFTAFIPSDHFIELVHAGEIARRLEDIAYSFLVQDAQEFLEDVQPTIH